MGALSERDPRGSATKQRERGESEAMVLQLHIGECGEGGGLRARGSPAIESGVIWTTAARSVNISFLGHFLALDVQQRARSVVTPDTVATANWMTMSAIDMCQSDVFMQSLVTTATATHP